MANATPLSPDPWGLTPETLPAPQQWRVSCFVATSPRAVFRHFVTAAATGEQAVAQVRAFLTAIDAIAYGTWSATPIGALGVLDLDAILARAEEAGADAATGDEREGDKTSDEDDDGHPHTCSCPECDDEPIDADPPESIESLLEEP